MNKDRLNLIAGNTYTLRFYYRPNGSSPVALPNGYDFVVGIYRAPGELVYLAKVSEGSITRSTVTINEVSTPVLLMPLSHDITTLMLGDMTMETTVLNDELSEVQHANNIVKLHFDPRYNNEYIEKGDGSAIGGEEPPPEE